MGDLSTKGREGVTPHQTRFPQTESSMPLPALGQSIHLASLLLHLTHQLQHLKTFVYALSFQLFSIIHEREDHDVCYAWPEESKENKTKGPTCSPLNLIPLFFLLFPL